MQEWCEDFYQSCETDEGCCLNCSDSHEGCLCYDCKCKKCWWYTPPEEWDGIKGHCDMVEVLKEERKQEAIDYYQQIEESKSKNSEILKKHNEKILEIIKSENKISENLIIPSWYTCQKCGREFVTNEYLKIKLQEEPICFLCGKNNGN